MLQFPGNMVYNNTNIINHYQLQGQEHKQYTTKNINSGNKTNNTSMQQYTNAPYRINYNIALHNTNKNTNNKPTLPSIRSITSDIVSIGSNNAFMLAPLPYQIMTNKKPTLPVVLPDDRFQTHNNIILPGVNNLPVLLPPLINTATTRFSTEGAHTPSTGITASSFIVKHDNITKKSSKSIRNNKNNNTTKLLPIALRRKHICKVCGNGFTTSGHLARHRRIHTGEKNHVCPYSECNQRFSRHDNCIQHYKTHFKKNGRN
ncbi:transcriptional regulator NRG1 SCDLUD_003703 [Saccharomycodes ludwigii]|uniref:transcriptional regulator NRG1 n=1 Tax=Saccharomycodes ludwigii TaxID=36035 RepID=UPI001E858F48|nr:hypothetical protein SCDLUD_003703 [Saccharomycodes ludwigii]KAH3900703.1 hypothetical protein SCDLUD_003703 [Saccharomycodes ludwigii]